MNNSVVRRLPAGALPNRVGRRSYAVIFDCGLRSQLAIREILSTHGEARGTRAAG
jgi:hypothetical protein